MKHPHAVNSFSDSMGAPQEGNPMAFGSSPGLTGRQPLSAEQKRRIDQNFRSAKAILCRKRPGRDAPTSPACQPPPTWRPFSSHERNAELDLKMECQSMHTQPAVCCNLGKTLNPDCTAGHINSSHFCKDGTMQRLPLQFGDTLIEDSDLNESVLRKLDDLSEKRAPLAELSANKVAGTGGSRLITQHDAFQLVSTEKDNGTNFCASKQERSLESSPASLTDSNPSSRVFSDVDVLEGPGTSRQLTTRGTFLVLPTVSGSEQSSIEVISKNLPFDSNRSYDTSNMLATGKSPLVASLPHNSRQVSMTMTEAVGCPISTPSLSGSQVSSTTCSEFPIPATEVMPVYLQTLNESQKEAALSDTFRPLLILAGPGSGKTSTMVARILRLLSEGDHAKNILAMTFTTAAATEMKDRVGASVGKMVSKELNVCTFHSFCLQLCRSHAEKLGRSPEFLVYGHSQQKRAVVEAVRLAIAEVQSSKVSVLPVDVSNISTTAEKDQHSDGCINPTMCKEKAKKWEKFVVQAKASGKTSDDYEKFGNLFGAAVLRHYNATLAACDALDYHDFISCAVALLRDNLEVLKECQTTWTCLLVDEFQDTSTMQYYLLQMLGSHKRLTVVGDDDQSIFSFNGADSNGFESFRKDFPDLKEVRLQKNYRSTRCIVEAASYLIRHNLNRCGNKLVVTENDFGERITVKECRNEDAQCSFTIDTIIMKSQKDAMHKPLYGEIAILYRRQVTGKNFQSALRFRKIPFNVHGVAFYRKKIIKTVVAMLWTALHEGRTTHCRRVFKALYGGDKAEAKKIVDYVDKVAGTSHCDFLEAARIIFTAKVSGTFTRHQLACGRKVLSLMDAVHRLARKEQSLSALVTTVVNLLPQRSSFQKKAIVDEDGGKFLNEDEDPRTVLEYFLEDVSDFLHNHFNYVEGLKADKNADECGRGCLLLLKAFLDHMTSRESENFKARREDNRNSVTLTTMHQSKGLEWDIVFIVKVNDSEVPLLHEANGIVGNTATSLEEERRLFYVGMTRARKKLYILYVTCDKNQQLLYPSRFIGELPRHLLDNQLDGAASVPSSPSTLHGTTTWGKSDSRPACQPQKEIADNADIASISKHDNKLVSRMRSGSEVETFELMASDDFLKGFNIEARSSIAVLFHNWAKKPAFQDPKRLLDKVSFAVDERLRSKTAQNKDTYRALKCCLNSSEALQYAKHVVKWEQIPREERTLYLSEKQEYFQQKCAERSMGSATATSKQISFLRSLGCTIEPTSRLHASRLIEQYKAL